MISSTTTLIGSDSWSDPVSITHLRAGARRLTLDSQEEGGVHDAVAVVAHAGVDALLRRRHVVQGQRQVGGRVLRQLLLAEHPGDLGRRVAFHLAVQRH